MSSAAGASEKKDVHSSAVLQFTVQKLSRKFGVSLNKQFQRLTVDVISQIRHADLSLYKQTYIYCNPCSYQMLSLNVKSSILNYQKNLIRSACVFAYNSCVCFWRGHRNVFCQRVRV